MFYSHTFLARKGSPGNSLVRCTSAAQTQEISLYLHRYPLNQRIMHPEVPIALRMSGHLLLGVVRIYSKQVDYLHHDCNVALVGISKAYSSANINLPEDATHAPYHAVTLPETFSLDALDLEDYYQDRSEDNHRKRLEEITIEDQIPTGTNPYIEIILNEDVRRSSSVLEDALESGPVPMEEDSHLSLPVDGTANLGDSSPSNHAGLNEENIGDGTPQDLPAIEIMRDAVHDLHADKNPILPDQGDDFMEPDGILAKELMKDKEVTSPHVGEILASGGSSLPTHQPHDPSPVASEQTCESLDLHLSLRHNSPELAIPSTPPAEQPRARQKKRRRQFFDESTVLTNKFMKKALENPSNLLRERRNCPSTNLEIWKLNNRLKKDSIFLKPLITGLSSEVQSIYDPQLISSKPHLIASDEIHQDADIPNSPPLQDNIEIEIEHPRDNEVPEVNNVRSEILPSPLQPASPPTMFISTPSRGDKSTPATLDFRSHSGQMGTNIGPEVQHPIIGFTPSTGLFSSDMETPATYSGERLGVENTGLYDIPELLNSAGDLNFLEQDDNTPAGCQGTPKTHMTGTQRETTEFDALSARTRAVAQYLRRQSSSTPISDQSGNLSMSSILEHKSRKICARMFFEMLVLKNCGLVDVHQDEPYEDIKLQVTPKLSREHLSS